MALANPAARLTPEAYLAWEATQATKNEYFEGEVFAMVGMTDAHNIVTLNVAFALRTAVRGRSCTVFATDVKVRPLNAEAYFYPDVFVTCDAQDAQNRSVKSHPILVVEVLSESTSAYDRGEKFAIYRKIEALREYLLIDPEQLTIDLFRLNDDGNWVLHDGRGAAEIRLESVELTLLTVEVFADVPAPS
jgi:Uma2 family endonuclease